MNWRRAYLGLRWMVDRDIVRRRRPLSLSVPFFLLTLGIGDLAVANIMTLPLAWTGIALSAGALLFSLWRMMRLLRAAARHGDRAYDRSTRQLLSAEYRGTESASRAHFRRLARRTPLR